MTRLWYDIQACEFIDDFAAHGVEHGLVVVLLLAGRCRRVVGADDNDQLAAAIVKGTEIGVGRIEPFGAILSSKLNFA